MNKPKEFQYLVDAFKSLPGMGTKNATRCAFFLINKDERYQNEFVKRIIDASQNLKRCELCNNISTLQRCDFCLDPNRAKSLCIVETIEDLERIDQSNNFHGYFHILDNIHDLKKFKLTDINLSSLLNQIDSLDIKEIIIATSFSLSGEAISEYLKTNICDKVDVDIFRIGFGVPLNVNIDYIDDETIRESLMNKKRIN
ncbi:MAG: toprim domain-containing protein [Mycoplasma sp.]